MLLIKRKAGNLFPNEGKAIIQLVDFKTNVKTEVPVNCPWGLRKAYIHQAGFIQHSHMIILDAFLKLWI